MGGAAVKKRTEQRKSTKASNMKSQKAGKSLEKSLTKTKTKAGAKATTPPEAVGGAHAAAAVTVEGTEGGIETPAFTQEAEPRRSGRTPKPRVFAEAMSISSEPSLTVWKSLPPPFPCSFLFSLLVVLLELMKMLEAPRRRSL
jgi:hypothetical protein